MTIYWPSRDPSTNQRKVSYIDGPILADVSYTFVEDIGFVGRKGDVNEDDVVNVQDVIISVNYALGGDSPEGPLYIIKPKEYRDNTILYINLTATAVAAAVRRGGAAIVARQRLCGQAPVAQRYRGAVKVMPPPH